MNPKAENSCAERRAKLSKQTAPRKSEKKFSRAKNFTDVGRRFEFERGKIKYTKAVNVFGLVTKSWQSKLTMKRYEKHSKRQGARANHPKQTALPERRAPRVDYPTRAPKADCPTRAPSAHFFRASRLLGVSLQLGHFLYAHAFFSLKTNPLSHTI